LSLRAGVRQQCRELVRYLENRPHTLPAEQRCRDVDGDHDVGAHGLCRLDGQIHCEAAVDEHSPVEIDRSEHGRQRHARTQREREVSGSQQHGLRCREVGCDRAERHRQSVEVLDRIGADRRAASTVDELSCSNPVESETSSRRRA
jgi:hypothetical protein